MATEEEKRLHRCCFTGHRPEKLNAPETEIKQWLEKQIDQAIAEGYVTFITGCAMGVDIWAGEIVLQKRQDNREENPPLSGAVQLGGFNQRKRNGIDKRPHDQQIEDVEHTGKDQCPQAVLQMQVADVENVGTDHTAIKQCREIEEK